MEVILSTVRSVFSPFPDQVQGAAFPFPLLVRLFERVFVKKQTDASVWSKVSSRMPALALVSTGILDG